MPSLKEVKNRIASVHSTRKITSAMKMIASAKLHRAQSAIENMLPYQQSLYSMLSNLLSSVSEEGLNSPYTVAQEVHKVAIVAVASNSSLAGGYNSTVVKGLKQVVQQHAHLGHNNVLVYPIGKQIANAAKKMELNIQGVYDTLIAKPTYEAAYELAQQLMDMYLKGEVNKVIFVYQHFVSTAKQTLSLDTLLPLPLENLSTAQSKDTESTEQGNTFYLIEPSPEVLLASLVPMALKLKVFTMLLDASAAEHAARTVAMQVATENANDLIQNLTIQYNKTRQQIITNELLDIIGGASALA